MAGLKHQSRTREMTMESHQYANRRILQKRNRAPITDFVVDGLLYGIFAGVVMLALLIGMGKLVGREMPDLLSMLGAPDATPAPIQGALRHIAMSGFYGIVWSLLIVLPVRHLRLGYAFPWRLAGICYGTVLWMIAWIVIQYWTALSLLPWYALLIAHMCYGGTLGYLQVRQESSSLPKNAREF
jgi:hypothetical protein